mgnify:CR=1 FL=1
MGEQGADAHVPIRTGLIMSWALEVLAQESPLARKVVLERVEEQFGHLLTDFERGFTNEKRDRTRWSNKLAWFSVGMQDAGWLAKTPKGWELLPEGREALKRFPNGAGMDAIVDEAYHRKRGTTTKPVKYELLDSALDFLEPGSWTAYGELAEVVGASAQTVGRFMRETDHEAAFRVLTSDGRSSGNFEWKAPRGVSQVEALESEGIDFSSGSAAGSQMMRAADFRELMEENGLLPTLPKRAWLVRGSAVDGHDLIPRWRDEGFVSLRAAKLRVVDAGIARDDLRVIVEEDYSHASYAQRAAKLDEFHAFLTRMQVGDIVATTSQGHLYVGEISGEVMFTKSDEDLANLRRSVEWKPEGVDYSALASSIKSKLSAQYEVVDLTQQIDVLEELLEKLDDTDVDDPNPPVVVDKEAVLADANDELADSLNVDTAWLQEIIDLLKDRPQAIFYGPPGTGKTFIARALAEYLAGDNVRLVQFHPGYSYEDFFEGFRPNTDGGFTLKPGPLRKTVDQARENPATPYFLIIDEINRGNIAKIFGELYFLLEYRDQTVELMYGDDEAGFTLPKNVFIIGTMNTADRSIALVDAAMRRRFAFVPLHPAEPPTDGVLRRWLKSQGHDEAVADLHEELNRRIDDPDFKIGPSYFMRPAVHAEGGLERAWRTAILPLLEEHHFGEGIDVEGRYGYDAIRKRVATAESGLTDETPDPS